MEVKTKEPLAWVPAELERSVLENEYLLPRRPFLSSLEASEIPAIGKWDCDFFQKNYGEVEFPIDGIRGGKRERLSRYLQKIRNPSECTSGGEVSSYMRNFMLFQQFPELREDFQMPWIAKENWLQSRVLGDFSGGSWRYWVELFISGANTRFPYVHIDPYSTHAWSLQLSGHKGFWLWPPFTSQFEKLLDSSLLRENPKRIRADTCLEDFFPGVDPIYTKLKPGQLLFIPAGWWHTTETDEESVTLGGNFVDASNWDEFTKLYLTQNPPHTIEQKLQRKLVRLFAPKLMQLKRLLRKVN